MQKPDFIIELEELLGVEAKKTTLKGIEAINFNKEFKYTLNAKGELIGLRITKISINKYLREIVAHRNTLKTLYLYDNQLSNIRILMFFKNLNKLFLFGNDITNIESLKGLSKLTVLNLSENKITNIEALRNLYELTELNLFDNQITDIKALKNLSKLTSLDLSENKITNIEALKNLSKLTSLDLSENTIPNIEALKNLNKLTYLYLANNQISNIEALRNLNSITYLDMSENKITDIEVLKNLNKLTELWLLQNQISNIEALKNLNKLTELYLSSNKTSNIEALKNLTNLTQLGLSTNQINNIEALKNLNKLTELYLSNNQINNIGALKNLNNVRHLHLNNNQINNIEALKNLTSLTELSLYTNQINNIEALKNLNNVRHLRLNNNPISKDLKIHSKTKEQSKIVKSWLSLQNKTNKKIKLPTKVLLLGNSKIGKTCLRLFLKGEKPCTKHSSTHILEVFDWEYEKDKTATIWDFGGQDYYHSVHHLFFTLSSLYVILYDCTTNKNEFLKDENYYNFNLNYWLENINYITPNKINTENKEENQSKKIMLVENKIDTNTDKVFEIPPKYQIKDKYRISLCPDKKKASYTTKQNFLKAEIIHELNNLKNETVLNISKDFGEIVSQIKESALGEEDKYHYTKKDFLDLCKAVNDQIKEEGLLYLLNSLQNAGLIFYFSEMPNDIWLYPNKLIQKIHDILNEKSLKNGKGKLKPTQIKNLEKDNLLNLLIKQEVIFRDDDDTYIFPQYLPVSEENNILYEIAKTNLQPAFSLKFEHFLPSAFMSRVICRFGKQENTTIAQKFYSRYEIIFTEEINNEKIRVWIKTDLENLQVEAFISEIKSKKDKEQYLSYLFKALLVAYDGKYEHVNFIDYIETYNILKNQSGNISRNLFQQKKRKNNTRNFFSKLSNKNFLFFNIERLKKNIWFNIKNYIPEDLNLIIKGFEVKYTALEALEQKDKFVTTTNGKTIHNSIFNAFIPLELKAPMKLFISYSHKDYNYLERLETHLAGLRREGLIEDWNDTKFCLGDHWNDKIKTKLNEADIVILLISADFINSNYVHDIELPLIKSLEEKDNIKIFPIIVEDCDWENQKYYNHIQAEPLHIINNGSLKNDKKELETVRPIERWEYKSQAYTQIVKKIRTHIKQHS